jgi:hypothetical protein
LGVVNISEVGVDFFITSVLFILFILFMLSLGVLRLFQLRPRSGIVYFVLGAAGIAVFAVVLNTFFM